MFGGYCQEAGTKDGGEHFHDLQLIAFLKEFLKGYIFLNFRPLYMKVKQFVLIAISHPF